MGSPKTRSSALNARISRKRRRRPVVASALQRTGGEAMKEATMARRLPSRSSGGAQRRHSGYAGQPLWRAAQLAIHSTAH